MACPTPASSFSPKRSENEIQRSSPATMIDSTFASSSYISAYPNTSGTCDHPNDGFRYDVFINHRGEDTKKTFASYLYHRLLSHGFRAFLDQQELQEGLHFPSQIENAIRTALVHVAIFSPKYAESRWCLEELHLMRISGTPIIPIFYHVDPSELRRAKNKSGVYGEALYNLQMKETEDPQTGMAVPRYDSVTIQNWSDALSSFADISGFDLDGKFKGDEGEMLEKVIKRVVGILSTKKKTRLYVAKYPTGLADKVNDFEKVLRRHYTGKVEMVGIVGLGGVGKTTLALEFFNRKSSEYNKSHFLSGVRENAKSPVQLLQLQRELLEALSEPHGHIENVHRGTQMLKESLSSSSSRFFIVLDDVDHEGQVDNLLPDRDVYYSNSLILITSRDRDVLRRSGVEERSIYKLTGLPLKHSRELFCSYAFCQAYPLKGFEHMVNEFLSACQGLPLSLKVIGALLFGKNNKTLWEDTLSQVHQVPDDIQKTLRISYDDLHEKEQQIFLDIACFFIGEKRDITLGVWDEPGRKGSSRFQNLESKCLVQVDRDNFIRMHDHLRDLGREIAHGKLPRRLWHPPEYIDTLLQQSFGSIEVRSIRINNDSNSNSDWDRDMFTVSHNVALSWRKRSEELFQNSLVKISNRLYNTYYRFLSIGFRKLELLETKGYLLECILRRAHSPHLIWLSWCECPYSYLPSWIPMQNLRVLKVNGHLLKTLWKGSSQAPLQLRELQIFGNISKIPKSIGQLKQLERIFFGHGFFQKLPEEFCDMRLLKVLVLKDCSGLKTLPESFGNLPSLQHMELSYGEKLERLPESFGNLPSLQRLELSHCEKLEGLPESFGRLPSLQQLELSNCAFKSLPESLGNLPSLQQMKLFDCWGLRTLPESFGNLPSLQHLELSRLETLPESLGYLPRLQNMKLSHCWGLRTLPESFGNLLRLQQLELSHCRFEVLPGSFGNLPSLQQMKLSDCWGLRMLPESFCNLSSLQHLELSSLETLPESFGNLPSLQHLELSSLETLPESFGNLATLQHLELSHCRFKRLPWSLGNLPSLQHMKLSDCRELSTLPESFVNLPSLQHLELSRLETLPESFGNLQSLQHLELSKLKTLPKTLGYLPHLQQMKLSDCWGLTALPESFGNLPSLQRLELFACWSLERLPECFGNLPSLRYMDLSWCRSLKMLPESFGNLPSLRHLKLFCCKSLERLPESFGNLTNLEHLVLTACESLEKLPESFGNLRNLQHLVMTSCENLRRLPESFGNLRNLQQNYVIELGLGVA